MVEQTDMQRHLPEIFRFWFKKNVYNFSEICIKNMILK